MRRASGRMVGHDSRYAIASLFESGLAKTNSNAPSASRSIAESSASGRASQTRTVPSSLPDASQLPSALKDTSHATAVWPRSRSKGHRQWRPKPSRSNHGSLTRYVHHRG
jgi:hypothetical protein